jgi:hypothetical protein
MEKHKGEEIIVNALYNILMEGRKLQLMTPRWFTLPIFNKWVKEPLTPKTGLNIYDNMIQQLTLIIKELKLDLEEITA